MSQTNTRKETNHTPNGTDTSPAAASGDAPAQPVPQPIHHPRLPKHPHTYIPAHLKSKGPRTQHPRGRSASSKPNTVESPEIKALRQKHSDQLVYLKETFSDWSDEDLLGLLAESNGNGDTVASKILEGRVEHWDSLSHKKKDKAGYTGVTGGPQTAARDRTEADGSAPPGIGGGGRGGFRGGRGGTPGRGGMRGGRGGGGRGGSGKVALTWADIATRSRAAKSAPGVAGDWGSTDTSASIWGAEEAPTAWGESANDASKEKELLYPEASMEDNQITFDGLDSAECERFIQRIRKKARAEKRYKDNDWIIELVSTSMTGAALRWYIRLDLDVAEDWTKLQRAMIDEWPAKENRGEVVSSSIPTPAAAPEPTPASVPDTIDRMSSLSLNSAKTGYIRVNFPGSGDLFVAAKQSNALGKVAFGTCDSRSQAMIVQFTPGCVHLPLPLLIQNSKAGSKYLAIAQHGLRAIGPGSVEWASLVASNDQSPTTRNCVGDIRPMVWSICPVDRSIQALWSAEGSDYRLTALFASHTSRLVFVSNVSAFRANYTNVAYAVANLIFEEI